MAKYRSEGHEKGIVAPRVTMRLEKWLWQARFYQSRRQAAEIISEGHIRINGRPTMKASAPIGTGDTLTLLQEGVVRLIRVQILGKRRGPGYEALTLYTDLDVERIRAATPSPLE